MKVMHRLVSFVLMTVIFLWSSTFTAAVPAAQTSSLNVKAPAQNKLLRNDSLLQTLVTVDAVEQPLGDVLSKLNPFLKVDISAEQNVADQRVTLHATDQPIYVVMGNIVYLLSHDVVHPYGYHWGSLERSTGERPGYQLWRDTASVAQERAERDYPRRKIAAILREYRGLTQAAPKNMAMHPGDTPVLIPDPNNPYNKAYRSLTDDQIDALVDGETVLLDPSLFSTETTATQQARQDQISRERAQALAAGIEYQTPPEVVPVAPAMRVLPADQDRDEGFLDQTGNYDIYLDGIVGAALVLNTYDTPKDPDPQNVPLPADVGPRVDLSPYLEAKTATAQQKGDLGYTLQALGRVAHLNIYQESFLASDTLFGQPHPGLTSFQGSVPRLIAQICSIWNYHAQPVPGGYLFWSRTWAQDRARDIPARLIAPWQSRLQKNGMLSLYDHAEIDAALTWPQVTLTLETALPEASVEGGIYPYRVLNLFGSLTPSEQTQALTPDGLPVSDISLRGQAALATDYEPLLRKVPSDRMAQSILKFRTEEAPKFNALRLIVNLDVDGQSLVSGRCTIPLKPSKTNTP